MSQYGPVSALTRESVLALVERRTYFKHPLTYNIGLKDRAKYHSDSKGKGTIYPGEVMSRIRREVIPDLQGQSMP